MKSLLQRKQVLKYDLWLWKLTGHAGHVPACQACDDTPMIPICTVTKYVFGNNSIMCQTPLHHTKILLINFTFPSSQNQKIPVRHPKRLTWVQQQGCDWSLPSKTLCKSCSDAFGGGLFLCPKETRLERAKPRGYSKYSVLRNTFLKTFLNQPWAWPLYFSWHFRIEKVVYE